ncbi:MAG: hypothetical protein ACREX8_08920 [Gammaproteobacteria bacterium]
MSEPTSDALFGVDGTQAPETLADPSAWPGRGSWQAVPELPPMWMPPALDDTALREAIAAALGDDAGAPAEAVEQEAAAVPAPQAEPQPTGQPKAPDVNVPDVNVADVNVADVNVAAPPHSTASAGAPTGRHGTEAWGRSVPRPPQVPAVTLPAPSQPPRPAGLGYRPPMAGTSRGSAPLTDLRRRIRRERVDLPRRGSFDGGATAFFLVMLIIIGLLVYNIIISFLDFISRLLP